MRHPITADTRLAGRLTRLHRRYFKPDDPHGWADYHCVEEPEGTFWVHTHGLRRWRLPDLEFVGVAHDMVSYAQQMLFEIIADAKSRLPLAAESDIEGIFSAPLQSFRQMATLRWAPNDDPDHRESLRIVDWGHPVESGFPRRLFASHIAAWADLAEDPARKEALCRRALALFPGCFLEMGAGAEIVPGKADLTDLQHRANLQVYLSLAQALFDQDRPAEATAYLEEAIARCPGWAQTYRDYLVKKYRRKDAFMNFWRAADLKEICARRRPANTSGPLPRRKPKTATRKRKAPARRKTA
ncbi:MAG: hypothetical protein JSU82_01780 [Rhodospirillales bacterium]|nr:MAG: hypothetical protein JSU82_01780 [Rhodospirillales bacterium]